MLFKALASNMIAGVLLAPLVLLCPSLADGARLRGEQNKSAAALHGVVSGYRWTIEVRHGKEVGVSPCVSVSLVRNVRGSVGGENSVCGALSPYPLVVQETLGVGGTSRSIVGMAFDADIVKVRVVLRGRAERNLPLHLLAKGAAERGNVSVLRYGAVAYSGATCVSRIVPYSKRDGKWQAGIQGDCD